MCDVNDKVGLDELVDSTTVMSDAMVDSTAAVMSDPAVVLEEEELPLAAVELIVVVSRKKTQKI